jgi:DNA-binding NtrC family response regulator
MANILVVDDEHKMRHLLAIMLHQAGHQVDQAGDGQAALERLMDTAYDLVVSDIKMPRLSGSEMLERMKASDLSCPVVFITAFATVEAAVESMRMGAADYITKPFDQDKILLTVERTLRLSKVMAENRELKQALLKSEDRDKIICVSEEMKQIVAIAGKVARTDSTVLLQGESGTGKELIARFIHRQSKRKSERFVAINCAAIPPQLAESELFGYEKGAFTGAEKRTQGKFEFANQGTLFLDEVGELSLEAQAKLLRTLQEKTIRRVGGNHEIAVDVRLICATNRNLQTLVKEGTFRRDLLFRINVLPIELPSLRSRKEDIIPLTRFFMEKFAGGSPVALTDGAMRLLTEYNWPGNVRELANAIERAMIFAPDHGGITAETLSFLRNANCHGNTSGDFKLPAEGISLEGLQADLVRQALDSTQQNKTMAAKLLGLTRAKFRVLLKNINNSRTG